MKELIEYLKKLVLEKFTGNVQINFFKGNIQNVNENKSLKLKK